MIVENMELQALGEVHLGLYRIDNSTKNTKIAYPQLNSRRANWHTPPDDPMGMDGAWAADVTFSEAIRCIMSSWGRQRHHPCQTEQSVNKRRSRIWMEQVVP